MSSSIFLVALFHRLVPRVWYYTGNVLNLECFYLNKLCILSYADVMCLHNKRRCRGNEQLDLQFYENATQFARELYANVKLSTNFTSKLHAQVTVLQANISMREATRSNRIEIITISVLHAKLIFQRRGWRIYVQSVCTLSSCGTNKCIILQLVGNQ